MSASPAESPASQPDRAVRAEAVVDLDAISDNVAALKDHVDRREFIAVVKADGYGHGIVPAALAARAGGAEWLGVAFLDEALLLRKAGDKGSILCWLAVPGERYVEAVRAGVEVSAYSVDQLEAIADAGRMAGSPAAVQLKLDSGLGRGGADPDHWEELVSTAVRLRDANVLDVTGVWSHLACSDEPGHPSIQAQTTTFEAGLAHALDQGLEPAHIHLANSGGALATPSTWFTTVRVGIAIYGVSPFGDGSSPVPLQQAMTLRGRVALVKEVGPGHGVSYGHTYVTSGPTRLALVPLGYGDGVPRHASSRAQVWLNDRRHRIAGRVCMDQFVLDVGDAPAAAGDEVVLFGDGRQGEPTAHDWAVAAETIGYEIVTRIGSRVPRTYVGDVVSGLPR
ncbi:MAG TPA: alanine racemase [Nocardioidaceae bacterium]